MNWLQLHLDTDAGSSHLLEQTLLENGALSITLTGSASQTILEPGVGETPLWPQLKLTALFPADINTDVVLLMLSAQHGRLPPWQWQILEDQPWQRKWMEHFEPMRCGQRLWICPSWSTPPQPEAINLMLDPGLAFGTGSHATTFLCLQWLDRLDLDEKILIDYGCGSGILAIAAALMGARRVIAIDNDPQALTATSENARRNGIGLDQLLVCTPETQPTGSVDFLVANILATPLIELADCLTTSVKTGGQLCLSGINKSQVDSILQTYNKHFKFESPEHLDEWARLSAVKI